MIKKIIITITALLLLISSVSAAFVCPVFNSNSQVGENNPNAIQIANGDYSIIGPNVNVPITATNDNGAGSPGGNHASPNDSTYTAIWN